MIETGSSCMVGLIRLSIDMTWPVRASLCPRVTPAAWKALCRSQLCPAYARRVRGRIHVFGMLEFGNRVPDKEKFVIGCVDPAYDRQRHNPRDGCLRAVPVDGEGNSSGDDPVLLIVLESPHTDEYEGSVANPIGPARGQSGTNLEDQLGALLGASCDVMGTVPCGTRVVVANPVQFQASLHAVHGGSLWCYGFGKLRDAVWESIWSVEEIRDDFRERIDCFAPTWIINACTGGSNGRGRVNGAVSEWLLDGKMGCRLYATTHPASWHRRRPRVSRLT